MTGILIVAHGALAEGLADSVQMLIGGERPPFCSLGEGGLEPFEKELFLKIDGLLENCQGVVIFCDLKGGTPANTSLKYKLMKQKNIEIVSGVNVPMLLEVLMDLENLPTPQAAADLAINTGKESIEKIHI